MRSRNDLCTCNTLPFKSFFFYAKNVPSTFFVQEKMLKHRRTFEQPAGKNSITRKVCEEEIWTLKAHKLGKKMYKTEMFGSCTDSLGNIIEGMIEMGSGWMWLFCRGWYMKEQLLRVHHSSLNGYFVDHVNYRKLNSITETTCCVACTD